MNVLARVPRATGAERKNFHLARLLHQFLHLAMLQTSCCQGGYASIHSEELQRQNHQIGRERPCFFGFQPPNGSRGRSRLDFRRGEDACVFCFTARVIAKYFLQIPDEFSPKKALCVVGGCS
jgi:hypothetical protein